MNGCFMNTPLLMLLLRMGPFLGTDQLLSIRNAVDDAGKDGVGDGCGIELPDVVEDACGADKSSNLSKAVSGL